MKRDEISRKDRRFSEEHKSGLSASEHSAGSRFVKSAGVFALHQVFATLGIAAATPVLLAYLGDLTSLVGLPIYPREFSFLATGTPYYPFQIALGLSMGWLLGCYFRHSAMRWVWVAPLMLLGWVVINFPTTGQLILHQYASLSSPHVMSHFFGWGCQPTNFCSDRLIFTMPFYASAFYSVGAWIALSRRTPIFVTRMRAVRKGRLLAVFGAPASCVMILVGLARGQARQAPSEAILFGGLTLAFIFGSILMTFVATVAIGLVGKDPVASR